MFGKENQPGAIGTGPRDADAGPGATAGVRLLTVSGDYAKIEGTFDIADSLEVECEIGGELNVRGRLTIGQNGTVRANVRTVDAVIKGTYAGDMVATGNVEITSTGRVTGNITTDSLVISKGGFFNGNVSRMDEDEAEGRVFLVEEEEGSSSAEARQPGSRSGGSGSSEVRPASPAKPGPRKVEGEEKDRITPGSRNA